MKRLVLIVFSVILSGQLWAQLGIGTNTIDSSAMLDVYSTTRGFLPPRIALTSTITAAPVSKPATGLLIYNTSAVGNDSTAVRPGYYYWDSLRWYPLTPKGESLGDMRYWNGTSWVIIPAGREGSVLTMCNGIPRWGGCSDSLAIPSGPNNGDAMYVTYNTLEPSWASSNVYGNSFVHNELAIAATYSNSATVVSRAFIAFNLSALPANATIVSAKLSLKGIPSANTIPQGNQGPNDLIIQRVLGNWDQSTVNWNNQPTTTMANQVELPATTATFNFDVNNIDVTEMVKAMHTQTPATTAGFCLKLKNETVWRSVVFASNRHPDLNKRPKLTIVYR